MNWRHAADEYEESSPPSGQIETCTKYMHDCFAQVLPASVGLGCCFDASIRRARRLSESSLMSSQHDSRGCDEHVIKM